MFFFVALREELAALPQHRDDEDCECAWAYLSRGDTELGAYPDDDPLRRASVLTHDDWPDPFECRLANHASIVSLQAFLTDLRTALEPSIRGVHPLASA